MKFLFFPISRFTVLTVLTIKRLYGFIVQLQI